MNCADKSKLEEQKQLWSSIRKINATFVSTFNRQICSRHRTQRMFLSLLKCDKEDDIQLVVITDKRSISQREKIHNHLRKVKGQSVRDYYRRICIATTSIYLSIECSCAGINKASAFRWSSHVSLEHRKVEYVRLSCLGFLVYLLSKDFKLCCFLIIWLCAYLRKLVTPETCRAHWSSQLTLEHRKTEYVRLSCFACCVLFPILHISLEYPFLIDPSVFTNVFLQYKP
jgi:hypothetical protein